MPLNPVQVQHVNEVVRPFLERLILARDAMDTFVVEYDALQAGSNALPQTTAPLDDGPGGTAPREDAPVISGAQVKILRDRTATMRDVIVGAELQTLIDKMVRSLAQIRG